MNSPPFTLDQLPPGRRGRIQALDGDDSLTQRLLEMGLLEGEEVEVLAVAPLGDPLEIRLGDYRLSLRRREAARVRVQEDRVTR
jgi:ferrous iron transport protein A